MPWESAQYTWISAATDGGIVLGVFVVGWILTRLLRRFLYTFTRRTESEFDDLVVERLTRIIPWLLAGLAAFIAIRIGPKTPELVATVDVGIRFALIVRITFILAKLASGMLEQRVLPLGGVGATTLTRKLLFWAVLVAGLVVALTQLGVEVTPVLAALGVGSLAVGLALQPTLTNVFAGFNLSLAQRLRVGDFVRLDGGQEGQIVDIGWRSTEIRALGDNIILVPNARLAELIVTNFSLPGAELAVTVEFGVAYESDLAHVERVLLEVARDVLATTPGAVKDFEPIVRYKGFAESSIPVMVVLRANEYADRVAIIDAFVRKTKSRFEQEGIVIPYPQRVVRQVGVEAGA